MVPTASSVGRHPAISPAGLGCVVFIRDVADSARAYARIADAIKCFLQIVRFSKSVDRLDCVNEYSMRAIGRSVNEKIPRLRFQESTVIRDTVSAPSPKGIFLLGIASNFALL